MKHTSGKQSSIGKGIKNLFPQSKNKRKSYVKPWKKDHGGSFLKRISEPPLYKKGKKIITTLPLFQKGRSYIPRTERRRNLRVRYGKILLYCLLFVLVIVGLRKPVMYGLGKLEIFDLKDIQVTGNEKLHRKQILEYTGLDFKRNLVSISAQELEHRLLSKPWIERADVKKVWPDGLHIAIREQRTVALLSKGLPGKERLFYVSYTGKIIEAVKPGDDIDFPVITGYNLLAEEYRNEAMQEASTFLRLISRNNANLPAQSVSEINFDKEKGMIIWLVEFPFPIIFGDGGVKEKYGQLRDVLAVLYKSKRNQTRMNDIKSIHMDYVNDKVIVKRSASG